MKKFVPHLGMSACVTFSLVFAIGLAVGALSSLSKPAFAAADPAPALQEGTQYVTSNTCAAFHEKEYERLTSGAVQVKPGVKK
ncbi:MAG: hypothetical protein ACOYYF_06065 [Chloroflexota bacterium]|nr:hypothetical protein [Chloroflexota bacterium]MBI5705144.1 hypothetical protein [Chloroflexota bacterium]